MSVLLGRGGGIVQLAAGGLLVLLGFTQVVGDQLATFQQIFGGLLCTIGGMQVSLGLLLVAGAVVPRRPRGG